MPPLDPARDSRFRQRIELTKDPRYLALKDKLAKVRAERTALKIEAERQRRRAEFWRQRALRKPMKGKG